MGFWMSEQCALVRLVGDSAAPLMDRIRALKQLDHPPLAMLRRLLVNSKTRRVPVPAKLKAVAALAYARELQERKVQNALRSEEKRPNPLGI